MLCFPLFSQRLGFNKRSSNFPIPCLFEIILNLSINHNLVKCEKIWLLWFARVLSQNQFIEKTVRFEDFKIISKLTKSWFQKSPDICLIMDFHDRTKQKGKWSCLTTCNYVCGESPDHIIQQHNPCPFYGELDYIINLIKSHIKFAGRKSPQETASASFCISNNTKWCRSIPLWQTSIGMWVFLENWGSEGLAE